MKIFESQSKKIRRYITFNIIIDWYEKNREKIAKLLKVNINQLEKTENIISQTNTLVNDVINSQYEGNPVFKQLTGFSPFTKLSELIIHDLIHNIYNVNKKEFEYALNTYNYSESAIIEEIECLCVEQIYLKFFNIKTVKTDFINQNLNLLGSYLCLTILKNDFERIVNYFETDNAYIEVYGKQYNLNEKDQYFNLFKAFKRVPKNIYSNDSDYVENIEDLRKTLVNLLDVEECIKTTNGDRKFFPNGRYMGLTDDFTQISEENQFLIINNYCEYNDIFYIIDEAIDIFSKYFPDFKEEKLEFTNKYTLYINKYSVFFFKGEIYLAIDEFDTTLVNNLRQDFNKNIYLENFKDKIDYFIEVLLNMELKDSILQIKKVDNDELVDFCRNTNEKVLELYYDSNILYYNTFSLEELVNMMFSNRSHAVAIFRRYFRYNNLIINDTGLESEKRNSIVPITKDNNFFFENGYTSLGKNLFTDNAKKLLLILDELRGFLIKNFKNIKQNTKVLDTKTYNLYLDFIKYCETHYYTNKYIVQDLKLDYFFKLKINFLSKTIDTEILSEIKNFDSFLKKIKDYELLYNNDLVNYKLKETIYSDSSEVLKLENILKIQNEVDKFNSVKKSFLTLNQKEFFNEISNGINDEIVTKYFNLNPNEFFISKKDSKNIFILF